MEAKARLARASSKFDDQLSEEQRRENLGDGADLEYTDSPRGVADLVNISSTAGRVARPGSSVYNLTKFGLQGFSESLRQEVSVERLRPEDIADAVAYMVTRDRRVAVNEILVRAAEQTW